MPNPESPFQGELFNALKEISECEKMEILAPSRAEAFEKLVEQYFEV
jgi:hypothetical protein